VKLVDHHNLLVIMFFSV